jgi:hypothetical protein
VAHSDVTGAETERRQSRVDVSALIVVISVVKFAGVFSGVAVGMAYLGPFPVVVEFVPGDGYIV